MSFSTIIEAEREADEAINQAKTKAKQMLSDAILNQAKAIEEAKTQGEDKLKADLVQFEASLKESIKGEKSKLDKQVATIEEAATKQKSLAVKQILAKFK